MARQKEHYPEHLFKEKERIGKLSQIRELIFGAQDGLLVALGVISSVAGGLSQSKIHALAISKKWFPGIIGWRRFWYWRLFSRYNITSYVRNKIKISI